MWSEEEVDLQPREIVVLPNVSQTASGQEVSGDHLPRLRVYQPGTDVWGRPSEVCPQVRVWLYHDQRKQTQDEEGKTEKQEEEQEEQEEE